MYARKGAARRRKFKKWALEVWSFAKGYLSFSKLLVYAVLYIDYKSTMTTLDLCRISVANNYTGSLPYLTALTRARRIDGEGVAREERAGRLSPGNYRPLQRTQAARPGIRRQVHGRMVRDVRLRRRYQMRTLGHYAARVRVRGYDFPLSFSCGEPLGGGREYHATARRRGFL